MYHKSKNSMREISVKKGMKVLSISYDLETTWRVRVGTLERQVVIYCIGDKERQKINVVRVQKRS